MINKKRKLKNLNIYLKDYVAIKLLKSNDDNLSTNVNYIFNMNDTRLNENFEESSMDAECLDNIMQLTDSRSNEYLVNSMFNKSIFNIDETDDLIANECSVEETISCNLTSLDLDINFDSIEENFNCLQDINETYDLFEQLYDQDVENKFYGVEKNNVVDFCSHAQMFAKNIEVDRFTIANVTLNTSQQQCLCTVKKDEENNIGKNVNESSLNIPIRRDYEDKRIFVNVNPFNSDRAKNDVAFFQSESNSGQKINRNDSKNNICYDKIEHFLKQQSPVNVAENAIVSDLSQYLDFKGVLLGMDEQNIINNDAANSRKPYASKCTAIKTNRLHDRRNDAQSKKSPCIHEMSTYGDNLNRIKNVKEDDSYRTASRINLRRTNFIERNCNVKKVRFKRTIADSRTKNKIKNNRNIFDYELRKVTSFDRLFHDKCIVSNYDVLHSFNDDNRRCDFSPKELLKENNSKENDRGVRSGIGELSKNQRSDSIESLQKSFRFRPRQDSADTSTVSDFVAYDQLRTDSNLFYFESEKSDDDMKSTSLNGTASNDYNRTTTTACSSERCDDDGDRNCPDKADDGGNLRTGKRKSESENGDTSSSCHSSRRSEIFRDEREERNEPVFDDKSIERHDGHLVFKLPTAEIKRPPTRLKSKIETEQICSSCSCNSGDCNNSEGSYVHEHNRTDAKDDAISLFAETNIWHGTSFNQTTDDDIEVDNRVFYADHVSEDVFTTSSELSSSLCSFTRTLFSDKFNGGDDVLPFNRQSLELVEQESTLTNKNSIDNNDCLYSDALFFSDGKKISTETTRAIDVALDEIKNGSRMPATATSSASSSLSRNLNRPLVDGNESAVKNTNDPDDRNGTADQTKQSCSFSAQGPFQGVVNSESSSLRACDSLKIHSNGLEKQCSNDFAKSLMFVCLHFLKFGSCRSKDTCVYIHQMPFDLENILRALTHDDLLNSYDTIIRKNKFLFKNTFPWVVKNFSEFNDRDRLFGMAKEVQEMNIDGDKLIYFNCIVDALTDTFMEVRAAIEKLLELFGESDLNIVDILFELVLREGYFENNWPLVKTLSRVRDYEIDVRHVELILKDCCDRTKPRKYHIHNVYHDIVERVANVELWKISSDVVNRFMGVLKSVELNDELSSFKCKLSNSNTTRYNDNSNPLAMSSDVRSAIDPEKQRFDRELISNNDSHSILSSSADSFDSKFVSVRVLPLDESSTSCTPDTAVANEPTSPSGTNVVLDKRSANLPSSFNPFNRRNRVPANESSELMQRIQNLHDSLQNGNMDSIASVLKNFETMYETTKTSITIQLSESKLNKVLFNNMYTFADHDSKLFRLIRDVFNRLGLYLLMSYLTAQQVSEAYDIFKKMYSKCKFAFLSAKLLEFKYTIPKRYLMCCDLLMRFSKYEMAFDLLISNGLLLYHNRWNFKYIIQPDIELRNVIFHKFMNRIINEDITFALKVFKTLSSDIQFSVDVYSHCNGLFKNALDNNLNEDVIQLAKMFVQKRFIPLAPSIMRAVFVIFSQNSNSEETMSFYCHCTVFNIFPKYTWKHHQLIIYTDLHIEEIRAIVNYYLMSVKKYVDKNVKIMITHKMRHHSNNNQIVPRLLQMIDKTIFGTKQRVISVFNSLKPNINLIEDLKFDSVLTLKSSEINRYLPEKMLIDKNKLQIY